MRNFGGALAAALVGAYLTDVWVSGIRGSTDVLTRILRGGEYLLSVQGVVDHVLNPLTHLPTWLLMGVIAGVVAKRGWNSVRSSLWLGAVLSALAIAALLISNPSLWDSPERNTTLFLVFAQGILLSQVSLVTILPTSIAVEVLTRGGTVPPPESILTRCECGAVFKSRPLICSECGRELGTEDDCDTITAHA